MIHIVCSFFLCSCVLSVTHSTRFIQTETSTEVYDIHELHDYVNSIGNCQHELVHNDSFSITLGNNPLTSSEQGGCNVTELTDIFTTKQVKWLNGLGSRSRKFLQIRKDIRLMNDVDRKTLLNAIRAMKESKIDGVSKYDIFINIHLPQVSPAGTRTGASQWGWHREYLLRFEEAVLEEIPKQTSNFLSSFLWDLTLDTYLPNPSDSIIWTDEFFGNSFNGKNQIGPHFDDACVVKTGLFKNWKLADSCKEMTKQGIFKKYNETDEKVADSERKKRIDQYGTYLSRSCMDSNNNVTRIYFTEKEAELLQYKTSFDEFSSAKCVTRNHDHTHAFIGGTNMHGDPTCAVEDPAVWFMHSYLDYLFEAWKITHKTEWPTIEQGVCHEKYDTMFPFNKLLNIAGVGDHYTGEFYQYQVNSLACLKNSDCGNVVYLWCDRANFRCMSKIRKGGFCGSYPDDICISGTCDKDRTCL